MQGVGRWGKSRIESNSLNKRRDSIISKIWLNCRLNIHQSLARISRPFKKRSLHKVSQVFAASTRIWEDVTRSDTKPTNAVNRLKESGRKASSLDRQVASLNCQAKDFLYKRRNQEIDNEVRSPMLSRWSLSMLQMPWLSGPLPSDIQLNKYLTHEIEDYWWLLFLTKVGKIRTATEHQNNSLKKTTKIAMKPSHLFMTE